MSEQKQTQTISVSKHYVWLCVAIAISVTIAGLWMDNKALKEKVTLLEDQQSIERDVETLKGQISNMSKSK